MNKEERARVEAVKKRIGEEHAFAMRVFRAIYEAQKPEEQFTQVHRGHDGRGFQAHETSQWCALYERIEERGHATASESEQIRKGMRKYAGQYLRLSAQATEKRRAELKGREQAISEAKKRREEMKPPESRYRSTATTPSKSPKPGKDDSLRGVFDGMDLDERVRAIEKMAERMGV